MENYAVLDLSPEIMRKIEETRGQPSRSEFLNCLVSTWCLEYQARQRYITQEEFRELDAGF